MTPKFIYVFGAEARDALLNAGYTIAKVDKQNNVFVFFNKADTNFSITNVKYVLSNTLTF